jgi:hypothetical protein
MSANPASLKRTVTKETAIFLCLLFFGLLI